MYYSYIEIEYLATSFSSARTDLALKLLSYYFLREKHIQLLRCARCSMLARDAVNPINVGINNIGQSIKVGVNG